MSAAELSGRSRRSVVLAIGAGGVGLALAACGLGSREPVKKLEGTVEFWTNSTLAYKGRVGEKLAADFAQKHPGVKINFTDMPDFDAKLVAASAAGTPPDMSYTDRFRTSTWACKGAARPLDDYIKRSPSIKMDNFWPLMREQVTYKGKVYGLPHQGNCGLLHYNKNAFREAGLNPDKPPATWSEALQAVQRLTKRSGDTLERAGWVPGRGFGVPWMVPYWQLGGEMLDKDGKKAAFNNATSLEAFDWLLRMHNAQGGEGAISQLYTGLNVNDAFAQGKTAMVWANNTIWRLNWASVPNLEIGVTSWPSPPNGKRATYMGGFSFVIPLGAKNPDTAFAYGEFKLTDESQLRWTEDWESMPSTRSAAQSERYQRGRPERVVAAADAPFAKFVIGAPGGDQALQHQVAVGTTILSGKLSPRDGLSEGVSNVQRELDDVARSCTL